MELNILGAKLTQIDDVYSGCCSDYSDSDEAPEFSDNLEDSYIKNPNGGREVSF